MPLTDHQIDCCVERYRREIDRYAKLVTAVSAICRQIVADAVPMGAVVSSRVKDPEHFRAKLARASVRTRFDSVDDVFARCSDLGGVRIATYVPTDCPVVVTEIHTRFPGPHAHRVDVEERGTGFGLPGYRATHCDIFLPPAYVAGGNENLRDTPCEIQVCSLFAHLFNEVEHGLRYKGAQGEPGARESRLLVQLAHLCESGDVLVDNLIDATGGRLGSREGVFVDAHDFISRMSARLNARRFGAHATELYEIVCALGLDSPEAIDASIEPCASARLARVARDAYDRLKRHEMHQGVHVLDDASADLLLAALLPSQVDAVLAMLSGRREEPRVAHLIRIAELYQAMREPSAGAS